VVGNTIDLQIIDAPVGILLDQRVIPGLTRGIVLDAPVGWIPGTGVRRVGHVLRVEGAVGDWKVLCHGFTRNSAHDVNSELEPARMHRCCDRFETDIAATLQRRRETRRVGDIPPVSINDEHQLFRRRPVLWVLHEPAFVNHRIIPAVRLQLSSQHIDVRAEFGFGDRQAVCIPAVPPHRRSRCQRRCRGCRQGCASGDAKQRGQQQSGPLHNRIPSQSVHGPLHSRGQFVTQFTHTIAIH